MEWLNREAELARLRRLAARRDGGLAVLWGRRRVGKTRLLVEWVRREGGIYFVADESSPAIQRRRLAEVIEAHLPGFGQVEYRDWASLLGRFARDAERAGVRGPIVLDELPYLVAASPDLPSILQRFIDHDAKAARLVVAFAGSSQRMMQGLVLEAQAPLYGRAREAFEVPPLAPGWLGKALRLRDPRAIAEAWSTWGGVPRYWELAADFDDRRQAIDALVLQPQGVLHDEPARLLLEELPPAQGLRPILDAIGAGAHKVTEIAGRIGTPVTSLGRSMTRLVELGLVFRDTPFGEPERSTKRSLYRLADPFLRLWFQVVAPHRATLTHAPKARRLSLLDTRSPHLLSESWEEMCRAAVPRLGAALGVEYGPARRYWAGSGPDWDVVAAAANGACLVGEVKWSTAEPTAASVERAYADLVRKGAPPFARGEVRHAIFLPEMPRRRPSRLPADVRLIDAAMVIDALTRAD